MPYKQRAVAGEKYIPQVGQPELRIHKAVCRYLKNNYPGVMFQSDLISGLGLRADDNRDRLLLNRMKTMNSDDRHPDLKIFARSWDGKYCGLAIEIKRDGTPVVIKIGPHKGELTKNEHIREQARALRKLHNTGWFGAFGVGYVECLKIIDWYFGRQSLEF